MTLYSPLRRSPRIIHLGLTLAATLLILLLAGCGGGTTDSTATATVTGAAVAPATPTTGLHRITPGVTPGTSSSGAGALDTTFGDHGHVITDLNGRRDQAHGVVVQADGKIVIGGESWVYPQDRPRFALVRYNRDGSLDTSFGEGGHVLVGMSDDEWDYSMPAALALQPDGKLLLAGTTASEEARHNVFAVARFNPDGSFDDSFGTSGRVTTAIDTSDDGWNDEAYALAVGADGRIVLAGVTGNFPTNFAATRYLPNGKLDPTFGNNGIVITDMGGNDKAQAVGIQPDGKIVLAGRGANGDDKDWALARYLPNGTLDPAFGQDGIVVTDFNKGEDWVGGLVIRPDGAILVGGQAQSGGVLCMGTDGVTRACAKFGFGLARYTPNGALDTKFGDGGKALFTFDLTAGAAALTLQPDGKIVLAGHYDDDDFAVVRANIDGTLDSKFGAGGLVRTPFGRAMDAAYAVAVQPDGQILAAGAGTITDDALNDNFILTRYRGK